ncbi:sensor histidine kinase [Sedimenticola hydrogenitrophicus]|uniref:sensor histidine kinase n=1 Tax=Sedimenticola hydrogenitrophicus TaxID=2967975 RepID=UPI0021A94B17|nr:ATP-binding protein [Sedimenticola hydrogenitrophicus]
MSFADPGQLKLELESTQALGGATEQSIRIFFYYRLILASLLGILFFSKTGPALLGHTDPGLFALTDIAYIGLVIASGLLLYAGRPLSPNQQTFLMVFVDIGAITLLMHASGGISSGLGMLLAVSIAAGSLITRGAYASLAAALASLVVLAEQVYAHLNQTFETTAYTQAGLLGTLFFAIAILAQVMARQLKTSEALSSQRKLDLADMEQLNDYVIQHMLTGIIVVDTDSTIRLMNESAWYLLGMPEVGTGSPLDQACHKLAVQLAEWDPEQHIPPEPFRPAAGGRELTAGFSLLGENNQGGAVIFLEDTATVTQQAQQMKLASLGRLTASVAHEIRNPLGAISHAGQLLRESSEIPQADRRLIDIISTNTGRVNEIIENILQLSRRGRSLPKEFLLKPWLEQFIGELARTLNLSAGALQLRIEPDSTLIRMDPSQFRQVFVILCENSIKHFDREREALSIQISGGITRESGGPFVDIIDNGPGIAPEHVRQMFEPFFTTRNAGTGLGLYIAKELCEANRLGLDYIPPPYGGSCFRITFPGRGNQPVR